ncbi:acyl-CoA dehydrogenase/oxidase [Diplogelasinospora grovesii]|uniref:Acyl-CoA dehydrogenase/oxidase n=1 Tax=Diplogelasinospora grovesii TaxID=303347 RepID=A0AAN6S349_9PEZI|nr:acyl-CoA dehydrogenase/oxidase [Diplogelasinospora grovesii]
MPIDFHLGATEGAAHAAAQHNLQSARFRQLNHEQHHERFQNTRPIYAAAVRRGLLEKQMIKPEHGGSFKSLRSAVPLNPPRLTIFATLLGLVPLNITGTSQHTEFLAPFLTCKGAPLASLVFSEPGGVTNVLEKGAPSLQTTARRDGDEWVINGQKIWATNCAGWDFKGCELACVVCRDNTNPRPSRTGGDPRESTMIILVTRADLDRNPAGSFEVLRHISMPGHTSTSGPHVRYTNVRVPAKNVLCPPGQGMQTVLTAFDITAVLVGAMGVGLMRAAFDAAAAQPPLERQPFADLLSGVKMQIEASRAMTWKAAHAWQDGPGDYDARRELALAAKIFCTDAAVKACTDIINAVGTTACDPDQPFAQLLNTAMALPIFDGGNVGIWRRHMQQLMLSPTYDPWAATYGPSKRE